MILSTCNRVEILAVASRRWILAGFCIGISRWTRRLLRPHLYEYRDREAVRHLFRVAASLDSMVVGEPQILGQVKDAYSVAREAGTVSTQLEPLLQSAFAAAKKGALGDGDWEHDGFDRFGGCGSGAEDFGSLAGKTVFLVGAGKMSELAARHLVRLGRGRFW
jgi:glutamyl-tRNA reductase